ncbi:MAG TPA: SpoIIE family protein phosphatase [Acidobacteriaceae bacterium]|jgi:hypothetical protein|nr:SpoIIE family protein phosphatase [Acidobacteriaceae bacterium]
MKKTMLLTVLLLLSTFSLRAQSVASSQDSNAVPVVLGHSLVALAGPWKFHIGDNPAWADPNFDDSAWESMNLGSKEDSFDPNQGTEGFVPGWTGKGHPGYSGYAWYRIRIRLSGADGALALLGSNDVDDSYQLFVNGQLIGSFGDFSSSDPTVYITQPRMFALPASVRQPGADSTMTIAFRFYMAPRELQQIDPGGMHNPPSIGFRDAITAAYHMGWEGAYRSSSSILLSALIYILFTLLILMLYVFDRTETDLLWPLAACALSAIFLLLVFFTNTTLLFTATEQTLAGAVMIATFVALWAITWWIYFGLAKKKWIRNAILVVALCGMVMDILYTVLTFSGTSVPHSVFAAYQISRTITSAAMVILLILIAYFGIRQAQRTDWMLLLALIFYGSPNLTPVYIALHIRTAWFPFGINLRLVILTSLASLFCFSVVLMRQFRSSQRRQQAMEEDVKQAQEVQQVLIPEELPRVPGLTIKSEYRPAREVGGDFFQILPHASDGSVLIVVGDVTGKGLQAGMLVALIVGAIRNQSDTNFDPASMLQSLNRRLCGRGHAHATCLALRIDADGAATLANAGHLPPYLNGKELPMEGALPLGMEERTEFPVMRFQLAEGDTLMLMSDGIVEAQDEQGQLFGFERIHELLSKATPQKPITAVEVANAAQNFGQKDDISVLSVTRTEVREAVFA